MEQSEEFKGLEALIKTLEQRLSTCRNFNSVCEESAKEAEREIEEHFAKCFNALASRKAALLREIAEKVNNQSMIPFV